MVYIQTVPSGTELAHGQHASVPSKGPRKKPCNLVPDSISPRLGFVPTSNVSALRYIYSYFIMPGRCYRAGAGPKWRATLKIAKSTPIGFRCLGAVGKTDPMSSIPRESLYRLFRQRFQAIQNSSIEGLIDRLNAETGEARHGTPIWRFSALFPLLSPTTLPSLDYRFTYLGSTENRPLPSESVDNAGIFYNLHRNGPISLNVEPSLCCIGSPR